MPLRTLHASASVDGGFFVLNRKVMNYIDGYGTAWERGPIERLTRDGQLVGFRHGGFWSCMDTLREKNYLLELWSSGKAPRMIW
jgi:glucose-1-phosphate cytidylyltransferase